MAKKGTKAHEKELRKEGKPLQAAAESFKRKGTEGSFGTATPKKIAAAKKKGGRAKRKAVFAENMKKLAAKRKEAA